MTDSITNDQQLPLFAPTGTLVPKLIHAGSDWVGQPYIYNDQSSVAIRSNTGQGILVDNTFGITLSGPIAFFESPESMFLNGGYFVINPLQLECIGSSSAFPIPWLLPATPRLLSAASTVKSAVGNLQAADPSFPGV